MCSSDLALDREQFEELQEILQVLTAERKSLNPSSQNFVDDQVERVEKYGENIRLSPAQWKWLRDLFQKHSIAKPVAPSTREPDDEMDDEIPF